MSYPYGFCSPQRPLPPQLYYQNPIPQQRQAPYSLPPPVYRPPPVGVRPPQQPYYPQYQIQNQVPPISFTIIIPNPITKSKNPQLSTLSLQIIITGRSKTPTTMIINSTLIKRNSSISLLAIIIISLEQPQYQQPGQQNQNKVVQPPKQPYQQQYVPSQPKPQSHPSQHRPEQQNQQIPQQQQQQQVNKPPQQYKQPQQSQKDDDLEKKFQDAIDRTRDLVQKYQNPQTKQPQQQQQQPNPQPKQEQHTNQPQVDDNQLQELALQYEDGYIYRGQGYEPATREGYGVLTDQDDNPVYDGQWKDNQYHGQGKLINVQAEQIDGPFDYQDLSVIENGWLGYEGDFLEGKMNGFGKLQLTNGEMFEGQFQDGMIDGEGVFSAVNGQTIKGLWREGVLTQVFA
ncbi:unnamed protein product (macronuclear) [Paramecium tetraurelia]|uniref:MORN repeat protein n=1 Tax=Paramecium tetraurelia TaxID=5888 RepID=A0CR71_PARTE|nr:uncharacterized protein GSPATT00009603001 [Paramecium tetraurelia]CAK73288.1 unnamed protein product [Paramecium tetraurelia]|eukprot:XP_001440685.1 hypothetical protein (macronuclear) [Paramecium tetraurelia strain d4-2]